MVESQAFVSQAIRSVQGPRGGSGEFRGNDEAIVPVSKVSVRAQDEPTFRSESQA